MALDIMTRIGNIKETGPAHINIAEALITRGDYDLAVDHITEALSACDRSGTALWLKGFAELNLARAYQGKGMLPEAFSAVELSVACMEKAQTPGMLAEALLQRAELELARDRRENARDTCEYALQMVRDLGMKHLESRGLRVRGLILEAFGDGPEAEESLRASVDLAARVDSPLERGLGLLALAQLYATSDDAQLRGRPYRRLARQATAALTQVGARVWVGQARNLSLQPKAR
jgi:tetratricopeptide (TPR) repeat protein